MIVELRKRSYGGCGYAMLAGVKKIEEEREKC